LPAEYKRRLNVSFHYTVLNISWTIFEANRLNGLKIEGIQNMVGMITNNTIREHKKGGVLITGNDSVAGDTLLRNVSLTILYNHFHNNSGRYALNVACNLQAHHFVQNINITFNKFTQNFMTSPYDNKFNARASGVSAVAIVSSSNVKINQNWFDNPLSKLQIATQFDNNSALINASYNWFSNLDPVYDLDYFISFRDKCNQQWNRVRSLVFDQSNRSNLATIVYWPFACNDRMWYQESSINLRPPDLFNIKDKHSLGGIYEIGASVLPVDTYTVTNDILVRPGAKLTLKSGTEMNFLNGIGMLVLGELVVDGVNYSPVKFNLANQRTFNLFNANPTVKTPVSRVYNYPLPKDGSNSSGKYLKLLFSKFNFFLLKVI
jgi:hypothetical protein